MNQITSQSGIKGGMKFKITRFSVYKNFTISGVLRGSQHQHNISLTNVVVVVVVVECSKVEFMSGAGFIDIS